MREKEKPRIGTIYFKKSKETHRSSERLETDNQKVLAYMMEILKRLTNDTEEIKKRQREHAENTTLVTKEMRELKRAKRI